MDYDVHQESTGPCLRLRVLQGLPEAQKKGTYHKHDSVCMTKKMVH